VAGKAVEEELLPYKELFTTVVFGKIQLHLSFVLTPAVILALINSCINVMNFKVKRT